MRQLRRTRSLLPLAVLTAAVSLAGCGGRPLSTRPAGAPTHRAAVRHRPLPRRLAVRVRRAEPDLGPKRTETTVASRTVVQPVSPVRITEWPAPPDAPPPVPVYWFGSPAGGRVYITIDDGWVPSPTVLAWMASRHLPLTAFLIEAAAREHLAYWRAFAAAGGEIEDHTATHPDLVTLPYAAVAAQWREPLTAYRAWFGTTPTYGRPPYGQWNLTVARAAAAAGLKGIVMWSAVMGPRGLVTWNHGPLEPGDIILLHWDPGLPQELNQLLAVIAARHLVPAPLSEGIGPGMPAGPPMAPSRE
jgi:peptidoglycan/xylan/chitin deacetylase (PgdA/CDA1 family)